ncbi:MAG: Crp/Fnr family transcriptional regulator [Nitrospina sp.]|nr:Crp/Fnr family transcriptional regulator [Nitrospina sp.]
MLQLSNIFINGVGKMVESANLDFLRKIDFLEKVSMDTLESLASECSLRDLKEGAVLFSDGEEGRCMYVILSGELIVSKNGIEIARRTKGDYLGEMALIESQPRSATVRSTVPSLLLEITQEQFQAKLASSPDVLMAIMKTLSSRARENLKILESQDSGRVRSHEAEGEIKLEEHTKYLMQEAGLTSREADVARLICEGLSDKEVAKMLNLSHHTVKDHLKKIYSKFRVYARSQLVSLMYK